MPLRRIVTNVTPKEAHTMRTLTARDHSYTVRRNMQAKLGKPAGHDFTVPVGTLWCELDDGTECWLLTTSNAGFNGITGWFERSDDGDHFTRSLGDVFHWELV